MAIVRKYFGSDGMVDRCSLHSYPWGLCCAKQRYHEVEHGHIYFLYHELVPK